MISTLRFALLPSIFTLGCGEGGVFGDLDGSEEDPDCIEDPAVAPDPWEEGYCGTQTYLTLAHMVVPYGWVGDIYAFNEDRDDDKICEDVSECIFKPEEPGTYEILLTGELFMCVRPEINLTEVDEPATEDFTWEGEGECGLAPEGDYGEFRVSTGLFDDNKISIQIGSWVAIITENAFYGEDEDSLLEGTVAADLSSITYHLVTVTLDESATITLQ